MLAPVIRMAVENVRAFMFAHRSAGFVFAISVGIFRVLILGNLHSIGKSMVRI